MKIVITNPSGLTENQLGELREIGEVEVYTDTNNDNYKERLEGADIAVIDCFLTPVTKEFLSNLPNLKFFSINSTGYDNVDVEAVHEANVVASHVPTFSTGSVAELAIGLMFAVNRKIALGDKEFREGLHEVDPGTPEADRYMGFNLEGKTLGVVGLGNIGTRIAEIGRGIGMNVIGYNRTPKNIEGIEDVTLDDLMERADVVVVALALNSETEGIISQERIASMKRTAVIVSIAGMSLFDQEALKEALNSGAITGAGFDTAGGGWETVKNTTLTPHIGYDTVESHENMGRIITENIKGFVGGEPVNII